MKAKAVSALRSECGLRCDLGAGPQVVGLAPQTTRNDRRANTMKTYLLRDLKSVEPQKAQFAPAVASRCAVHESAGKSDRAGAGVAGKQRRIFGDAQLNGRLRAKGIYKDRSVAQAPPDPPGSFNPA